MNFRNKYQSAIKIEQFNKIQKIDAEQNSDDQDFLMDIQKNEEVQVEQEVDMFMNTFFDSYEFMNDIDLKQINEAFKPIISSLQKKIKCYKKKNKAIPLNKYFNSMDESDRIIIQPQLNSFDQFAQQIQINIKHSLQINQNQIAIEIPNKGSLIKSKVQRQVQKAKDPINREQIKSIQKEGRFTVFKQDGNQEIWEVQETFYHSDKYFKRLFLTQFSKILKSFISSKEILKEFETSEEQLYDFQSGLNLLYGLIIFLYIPQHFINILIGIPLRRIDKNEVSILQQFKERLNKSILERDAKHYFEYLSKLQLEIKIQERSKKLSILTTLNNIVINLNWSTQLYDEIQYIKLVILIMTYEQYLTELVADQKQLQQEFQQFLCDFKAYLILKYFKKKIFNGKEVCQNYICDCIYMIRKYNLPQEYEQQYLKVLEIAEQSKTFTLFIQKSITYYNSNLNLYNEIKRDSYFWKIKYYWKNYKLCLNDLDRCWYAVIYGNYGLVACFSCSKNKDNSKVQTLSSKFADIKQRFEQNKYKKNYKIENQDNENNDDNDGLFGGCCERFECGYYMRNYFCLYFMEGIIFTNILLRLFCFFYILFYLLICFIIILSSVFYIVIMVIFTLFIYDFSNPKFEEQKIQLVYPRYFPIFQIFSLYPIRACVQVVISLIFLTFGYTILMLTHIFYMPIYIKNFFSINFIRIFGQIPEKNSLNCYRISDLTINDKQQGFANRENKKINCQLSFEQIKILIKKELQYSQVKLTFQNINNVLTKRNNQNEKNIENINSYLPFPEKTNQINQYFQKYNNQFLEEIKEMFDDFYQQSYQIHLQPNCQLFYEKSELELIQIEIIDYLKQLYDQDQQLLVKAFQVLSIKKNDFKSLSEYMIVNIFKDQVEDQDKTFVKVFEKLTNFPVVSINNQVREVTLQSVNDYVKVKFGQPEFCFSDTDLEFEKQLNKFNKWNSKKKYFK